jgi:formamidopyrimidine-DNA glycosylase
MPELPEVETTRQGIDAVALGQTLVRMTVRERRMRWPISAELPAVIDNEQLLACDRRGKYLLMRFEKGVVIVHLGMSGSIRAVEPGALWRTHDHVGWLFKNQVELRLHDPRRFGAVLWHDNLIGSVLEHPLIKKLGIEPFDIGFTGALLKKGLGSRQTTIKQALLAGDVVVGVGNIYASESLFRARIHPETPAGNLTPKKCNELVQSIIQTLTDALSSGGSTLRDYVNATGEPGAYFTLHAAVYDRAGQPCKVCHGLIERMVQNQRATYFCKRCQKRPKTKVIKG